MAVEVRVEAGGLDVEGRQPRVDAAGQRGVGGLTGQGLDVNLQGNVLGHVWDGEDVLGRRLGELPCQLVVGCADPGGRW